MGLLSTAAKSIWLVVLLLRMRGGDDGAGAGRRDGWRVARQGWSCGVNTFAVVWREKKNGWREWEGGAEEEVKVGTAKQTEESLEREKWAPWKKLAGTGNNKLIYVDLKGRVTLNVSAVTMNCLLLIKQCCVFVCICEKCTEKLMMQFRVRILRGRPVGFNIVSQGMLVEEMLNDDISLKRWSEMYVHTHTHTLTHNSTNTNQQREIMGQIKHVWYMNLNQSSQSKW